MIFVNENNILGKVLYFSGIKVALLIGFSFLLETNSAAIGIAVLMITAKIFLPDIFNALTELLLMIIETAKQMI